MRRSSGIYGALLDYVEEMKGWTLARDGCDMEVLGLDGAQSRHKDIAERIPKEAQKPWTFDMAQVLDSVHYIAEENPDGVIKIILDLISGGNV